MPHTVSRLTYSILIDIHGVYVNRDTVCQSRYYIDRDTVCRSAVVPNCTISDVSTFFIKKTITTFLFKKMNFEWYRCGKIGDAKFYMHRQHVILVLKHILHF